MKLNRTMIMTSICFLSYFLFGFVDNMKGATLPLIFNDLGLSYTDGAVIVLGEYSGFIISTLLMGILADIFDKRVVMLCACGFLGLGIWGYSASSSVIGLLSMFALVGVGCGAIELGGSNIVSDIHEKKRGRYLNLLSCCHGVGSMLVPFFVGVLASMKDGWRLSYRFSIILVVVVGILFVVCPYPEGKRSSTTMPLKFAVLKELLTTPKIIILNFVMFCYVATEIGVSTWLADFLMKDKSFLYAQASVSLSVYFGCIMFGRFIGSIFVDRLGLIYSIALCALGAIIFLGIGITGTGVAAFALPFVGVFYSIIFPTTTALVSGEVTVNQGTALGILFCSGGLGGMLGPWLIGLLNGSLGLKYGMGVNLLFCCGILVGTTYLLLNSRKHHQ